jgi:hypothetical protein
MKHIRGAGFNFRHFCKLADAAKAECFGAIRVGAWRGEDDNAGKPGHTATPGWGAGVVK